MGIYSGLFWCALLISIVIGCKPSPSSPASHTSDEAASKSVTALHETQVDKNPISVKVAVTHIGNDAEIADVCELLWKEQGVLAVVWCSGFGMDVYVQAEESERAIELLSKAKGNGRLHNVDLIR